MIPETNLVKINLHRYEDLISALEKSLFTKSKVKINYINFYSFNLAISNISFNKILNSFDFNFPDGIGIWFGLRLFKIKISRFNLTDYGFEFMKECEKRKWRLFFLGSHKETLLRAKTRLLEHFPELNITGMIDGYESLNSNSLLEIINRFKIDILLVGLGSLKQENWIYENSTKINSTVFLSVGDLFNLYAGEKHRGNKTIRSLGLEWMVRLMFSPFKYTRRYVLGIPEYLFNLIRYKMRRINPFVH